MTSHPLSEIALRAARYEDAPPGLPDHAIVFSNTERRFLQCGRKYFLGVIEGLKTRTDGVPRSYGVAWHAAKEPIYQAWLEDRPAGQAEVRRALSDVRGRLARAASEGRLDPADAVDIADRLDDNLDVWMTLTGGRPPTSYRLIAYELPLAMPVLGPTGRPYAPEMFLVPDEQRAGEWRLARAGDDPARAVAVRWPFYFIGRLDMVFQNRATGALRAGDDKTSAQPETYLSRVTNDPQVPSYLTLLRHAVRSGHLPGVGPGTPVEGFWHRVTASQGFAEAKQLKGTKNDPVQVSTAKNMRVPSWRYRAKLEELGLDPRDPDYAAHLVYLQSTVDQKIELHEHMDYSDAELDRLERELHGHAQQIAKFWRDAFRLRRASDADRTHPRNPVCQLPGGSCDLVGPCMRDGEFVRRSFDVKPWQTWGPRAPQAEKPPSASTEPPAVAAGSESSTPSTSSIDW